MPYLGNHDVTRVEENGKSRIDTVYYQIPEFEGTDQKGRKLSSHDLDSSVYIADFFFTTCPSYCPRLTGSMERIEEQFGKVKDFRLVSFSVDPDHDNVPALADYGKLHHADPDKWFFVRVEKNKLHDLAMNFLVIPPDSTPDMKSKDIPHSPYFILVDKKRHIRGMYDGNNPTSVDSLMGDLRYLLKSYR